MSWVARLRLVLLPMMVLLCAGTAAAQGSIDRQVQLLRSSSDFRVRTQAALALGASKDKRAVAPLCGTGGSFGLNDSNTTVRIASAAALGKLALGGKECLEARLGRESSSSVKAAIKRAIEQIAGGAAPAIEDSTKYYVAVGTVSHDVGRSSVDGSVRKGMSASAARVGGFAMAPSGETPDQAKAVLAKYPKLKAFYLSPKITTTYAGGNLTVRISVAILTYPGKAMLGQFSKSITATGVSQGDTATEDELIQLASEKAMDMFAPLASRL